MFLGLSFEDRGCYLLSLFFFFSSGVGPQPPEDNISRVDEIVLALHLLSNVNTKCFHLHTEPSSISQEVHIYTPEKVRKQVG